MLVGLEGFHAVDGGGGHLPRVKRTDVMGFRAERSARRPPLGC